MVNHYFFDAAILTALAFAIIQLSTIGRSLMSTQETVDQLTAQVAKIHLEVTVAKDQLTAQLADVLAQLEAAGAVEKVDVSGLQAAIQKLDDINPDPVVDEPVDADPVDSPPF
jgi:hypothetical protein